MKKTILLGMLAVAGILTANADTKMMRIHYADGRSELVKVTDMVKLTFEEVGDVPETGDQMVDMGLSVMWASYNMGATKPEEYGNFYAYGEIEPKTEYTLLNYKWYYPDYNDWDCDEWEKYFKLGATFTGTNYDVAHVKWGDKWRVPTHKEWTELITNCTWKWVTENGVAGMQATSKINGNTIFLPAAGNMVDADHTHDQTGCFYWTSSEYEQDDITSECRNYRANLDAMNQSADGYDYPEVGFSVRAVYGDVPEQPKDITVIPSEPVDLGLSVKWAPFNIGASTGSGKGNFYCWGETATKQYSHTYNYKWYDPLTDSIVEIGDQISDTDYDVAKTLWGDGWRLPTQEEMQELLDQCTWTATTTGYTVTGPNGNSIFLPAYGFMTYKGAPRSSNEHGYYMTGNADTRTNYLGNKMIDNCTVLKFIRSGYGFDAAKIDYFSKAGGVQVRPVHE